MSQRVLLTLGLGACLLSSVPSFAKAIRTVPQPVANEYIVVLNEESVPGSAVAATANEMSLRHGGRLLAVLTKGIRGYGIEIPPQRAAQLAQDPRVAWVEENALGHLSYDVEYYTDNSHYNLDRIDQHTPIPQSTLKAYAWTSAGRNVDVYVVDTGIQSAHTEFSSGNVLTGADYAGGDGYTATNPCGGFVNRYNGGHGTAVASIIAGRTVGVARNATLIPVKVGRCNPNPTIVNPELQIDAISVLWGLDWVLGRMQANPTRRAVVNMSLYFDATGPFCIDAQGQSYDCRGALENNVRNVINGGAVVVASANNQNQNLCAVQSPARLGYGGMYDPGNQPSWPFVIVAGGTNLNDGRYLCATCTATERGSNFGPCVGIYAPAHQVRSAHIASSTAYRDQQQWVDALMSENIGYRNISVEMVSSGTSFAAPVLSGVAARVLETFPTMTVRQVWDFIRTNANILSTNFDGDNVPANDRLVYLSANQ